MQIVSIQSLSKTQIENFKSYCDQLDLYFHCYALENDIDNRSKTFVCLDENIVKGYITLSNSEVDFKDIPYEYKNKTPRYPFPAIKIARLAVSYKYRHKGIGKALLKEAISRATMVSVSFGVLILTVDAKKDSVTFYEHFGFKKLIGYEEKYFISIQTLVKALLKSKD